MGGLDRTRTALVAAIAGLGLNALAVSMLLRNLDTTWPYLTWSTQERSYWALAVASAVTLALAGPYLVWRLPRNPTGWWLTIAGGSLAIWIAASFTHTNTGLVLEILLPPLGKAALVIAVVGWPTGRLPARWTKPLALAIAAYLAVAWSVVFVTYRAATFDPRARALPKILSLISSSVAGTVIAALVSVVAPVLFIAVVCRGRAGMPPGIRTTTRPAFVAAVLLAASEVVAFISALVGTPLARSGRAGQLDQLTGLGLTVAAGRWGIVAALVLWSEARRRRVVRRLHQPPRTIELGMLRTGDHSTDVTHIVGDPTARLEIRAPDGSWPVRATGHGAAASVTARSRIEIADRQGRVVAAVDHDTACVVTRATRDALMASIGLVVARDARRLAADQQLRELRTVQRHVLDAQDRARRRLERDLHDGVQQRLVALSLDASLLARRERASSVSDADRERLSEMIARTIATMRELLSAGTPGVLDRGLAAGLVALDATIPLPTSLTVEGDVAADHPAATALWYVASEAVANALKHANAASMSLALAVDAHLAELTVSDDGCGGLDGTPTAIVQRLDALPAAVEVSSPRGIGTTIHVSVQLTGASS